jgi:hypothetical protein
VRLARPRERGAVERAESVVRVGPERFVLWCCESGSGALLGAQDNSVAVLGRCVCIEPGREGGVRRCHV